MKFKLIPVEKKPRNMSGWGSKRFKKRDKYDFEGDFSIEIAGEPPVTCKK